MTIRKLTSSVLIILFTILSLVSLAGVHVHHHDGNVHLALDDHHHNDTDNAHHRQSVCYGESPLEHIFEHKELVEQVCQNDTATAAMVLPPPVILSPVYFICCRIHVHCNKPHTEYYQPVPSDRAPPA